MMKTALDFMGMTMILLLGIIVILGMGIVIAFECRVINRLRKPEAPQLELAPYRPFEMTRRR
jgi:hypothetical protein